MRSRQATYPTLQLFTLLNAQHNGSTVHILTLPVRDEGHVCVYEPAGLGASVLDPSTNSCNQGTGFDAVRFA